MEETSDDEDHQPYEDQGEPLLPIGGAERGALGVIAVVLGLIGAWMFWIVNTFLGGEGWYDLIVGLILDELILAVELFSLILLVWAIFAPAWMARVIEAVSHKLVLAIAVTSSLFGIAFLVLIFVMPILLHFKILR